MIFVIECVMEIRNTMSQLTSGAVVAFYTKVIIQASSFICAKGDISRIGFYRVNLGLKTYSLDCFERSDGAACEWPLPIVISRPVLIDGYYERFLMSSDPIRLPPMV